MEINDLENLIIKSKIIVQLPDKVNLSELNRVIEKFLFSQDMVPQTNLPSPLVLDFIQASLVPAYCKPTQWEFFRSWLYRIFHFKEDNFKKTPQSMAYLRELNSIVDDVTCRISIKISPKENRQFVLDLMLFPVLYQKIYQSILMPNRVDYEWVAPRLLLNGTRMIELFSSALVGKIIEEPHFTGIAGKQQIFISHSQLDKNLKNFINNPISITHVAAIYEEYEKLSHGEISRQKITSDISGSIAIIVLFSKNVNDIPFTRDWVAFESGYAAALKRDVWVFEVIGYRDKYSFITPGVTDYFPFNFDDENYLKYLIRIIQKYDLNCVKKEKLKGTPYVCSNCSTQYNIHCPDNISYPTNSLKCPVCNNEITIKIGSE